jgi:hypothetical protein
MFMSVRSRTCRCDFPFLVTWRLVQITVYKSCLAQPDSSQQIISVGRKPNSADQFLPKFWQVQWPWSKRQELTNFLVVPSFWSCQNFGWANLGSNQTHPNWLHKREGREQPYQAEDRYWRSALAVFDASMYSSAFPKKKYILPLHCETEARPRTCQTDLLSTLLSLLVTHAESIIAGAYICWYVIQSYLSWSLHFLMCSWPSVESCETTIWKSENSNNLLAI